MGRSVVVNVGDPCLCVARGRLGGCGCGCGCKTWRRHGGVLGLFAQTAVLVVLHYFLLYTSVVQMKTTYNNIMFMYILFCTNVRSNCLTCQSCCSFMIRNRPDTCDQLFRAVMTFYRRFSDRGGSNHDQAGPKTAPLLLGGEGVGFFPRNVTAGSLHYAFLSVYLHFYSFFLFSRKYLW